MRYADDAVIVTNPEVSSVRDSDRIIGMLDSKTVKAEKGERIDKHLLITRYDAGARRARRDACHRRRAGNPVDARCSASFPESQDVLRASNVGSPVTLNNADSAPARAYFDAARRLNGETSTMLVPRESKGLHDRLFGRRAA